MCDDGGVAVGSARARRSGTVVAIAALAASFAVAIPVRATADTPITGVDLSQYSLVARYELPEPTRTAPPPGSLLAQEASSVTYDWDTDTLFCYRILCRRSQQRPERELVSWRAGLLHPRCPLQ